jgi:hypothetical protein
MLEIKSQLPKKLTFSEGQFLVLHIITCRGFARDL